MRPSRRICKRVAAAARAVRALVRHLFRRRRRRGGWTLLTLADGR